MATRGTRSGGADVTFDANLRQEDRLLHRGIAAADDHDFLVAVESGVADRAVGDSAAVQGALEARSSCRAVAPGCRRSRLGAVTPRRRPRRGKAAPKVDARDVVGEKLGPEPLAWRPDSPSADGPMIPSAKAG